jgi:hypothetical protein
VSLQSGEEAVPRIALSAFALFLAAISLSLAAPAPIKRQGTLGEVVKSPGLPRFSAHSAIAKKDRLEVSGLKAVDPRGSERLQGRTLLYCDPSDVVALWLPAVAWKMKQAAPTTGREGPGANLWQAVLEDRPLVVPLSCPVQITLVSVDDKGVVRHTETARVAEVQFVPQK